MIEFYKDNLVPPELCRMLYEVVPKEHHVPVRFHNRRREEGGTPGLLASVTLRRNREPSPIDINLNPIYNESHRRSRCRRSKPPGIAAVRAEIEGVPEEQV